MIAGAYAIFNEDLYRSYAASHPANITILTQPFDETMLDSIRRVPGVAHAEGCREITVHLRVEGDKWDTLLLIGQPDYADIHINRRFPKEGALVPVGRGRVS